MKTQIIVLSTFMFCSVSLPSIADDMQCKQLLNANFSEGAPRDNFKFNNVSGDHWQVVSVAIDLAGSSGKLIFDTEDGGTGVEVFQPYKTENGSATVMQVMQPEDGADKMQVVFSEFTNQQSFRFSIDVDDTLTQSDLGQIRVTGSEMSGAALTVVFAHKTQADTVTLNGTFINDNTATLQGNNCPKVK